MRRKIYDEWCCYAPCIKDHKIRMLLLFIEKYVNAATKQHERIWQHRADIANRVQNRLGIRESMTTLFSDVHFYFICWDVVYKLFIELCGVVKDVKLKEIETKYVSDFVHYKSVRNHLEHIDERLVGKVHGKKPEEPQFMGDLGNLAGDDYTFWGKKYSVGDASFKILSAFYDDLLGWIEKITIDPKK